MGSSQEQIPHLHPGQHPRLPSATSWHPHGFILLRSPIGPSTKRIRTVKETVARLHDLPSSGPVWLYQSWRVCSALALLKSHPKALGSFDNWWETPSQTSLEDRYQSGHGASLPSSLGWLNLRQASVHASAAYIGSLHQSRHLVAKILGRTAPQSTFPTPSNPWESIQDIDVPLSQHDQPTVPYEM